MHFRRRAPARLDQLKSDFLLRASRATIALTSQQLGGTEDILAGFSRDDAVWHTTIVIVGGVAVIATVVSRRWQSFIQWLNEIRGRDWAITSATIDVVSVVVQTEQRRGGERIIGYQATLTYFYRNPDLQMGEYVRMFDREVEARTWADRYKGCNVLVHVDPRDPTSSALLEADLDAVTVSTANSG